MEGWNDCPIPVPTSSNGASSTSGTLKARKRISRLPIMSHLQNSGESLSGGSSRGLVMPPVPLTLPPTVSTLPKPPQSAPTSKAEDKKEEETVDVLGVEAKLRELVDTAPIAAKEKEFFTKRLVDAFSALAAPHQRFVSLIVDGVVSQEPALALKGRVLNYMMVNSGVSMWGVPLKKLVESLKGGKDVS